MCYYNMKIIFYKNDQKYDFQILKNAVTRHFLQFPKGKTQQLHFLNLPRKNAVTTYFF